jgi:hypothetical protein
MADGTTHTHLIKGTPLEIGSKLFIGICMPVIQQAQADQGVAGDQLAHLYAGFLQACLGSLAADFGHEQAIHLAEMMVESFKAADLSAPAPATH